jgi:type I restriction enzyme R subunit
MDRAKLEAIREAVNHLLDPVSMGVPDRFRHHSRIATQSFALAISLPETMAYRDDLAFFQAVAVGLRADDRAGVSDDVEFETALRQVVSDAITSTGVIDIYEATGIAKPDLSIIDEEFTKRLFTDPHPNLQIELLRRLLASEVRAVARHNVVAERRFSEMLERAMKAYNNRSLTAAEVIVELVELAKEMKIEHERGATLGLRDDELAFYDAVCQNDSAVMELGDDVLKQIAQELVTVVRKNTTVDWDKKEQVRASLRRTIRRLLTRYNYPPDKQEAAVMLVMQQAEVLASDIAV